MHLSDELPHSWVRSTMGHDGVLVWFKVTVKVLSVPLLLTTLQ